MCSAPKALKPSLLSLEDQFTFYISCEYLQHRLQSGSLPQDRSAGTLRTECFLARTFPLCVVAGEDSSDEIVVVLRVVA